MTTMTSVQQEKNSACISNRQKHPKSLPMSDPNELSMGIEILPLELQYLQRPKRKYYSVI